MQVQRIKRVLFIGISRKGADFFQSIGGKPKKKDKPK